ncbi:hypothetical protein [Novosphingobium sp.]|uniref:hypothetical protein n=1 Tax=Novosphingobium sp. TaxID=1874826 RepID=UPI0035AEEBA9
MLGIFSGLVLAGITPTSPLPTKQPEWRTRAASLRAETESLYAWSMPQDLSPSVGYGSPSYHQAAVYARYDPQWRVSPQLPSQPALQVEEAPPVLTGNEATVAELEVLGESFDQPPEQAEMSDAEQDLSGG